MRHGVAFVAGKYPNRSGPQDYFTYCADAAADIGADAVKAYATPTYTTVYPNQTWGASHTTLTGLVQDAAYAAMFSDARLTRFFLNTWTFANGINNKWINEWTNADDAAEYTEIYNMAVHLLSTYSGKEFVIQNWEGDWALLGSFVFTDEVPPQRANRMACYMRARQRAIRDARAAVTSTSTIVCAFEVNRCLDKQGARVHEFLDRVRPDAVSFSLYECINTYGANQAECEANIERLMTRAAFNVRRVLGPQVRLYIGEYGWPEAEPGFSGLGLNLGALIQKVIDTADALGFTDMVFWNLFDNEEQSPGVPRGYYVYDETLTLSDQGTKLATVL